MRQDAERLNAPFMKCWSLYVSGIVTLDRDPREGRRLTEAGELGREIGQHHMLRFGQRALGVAALLEGDQAEASQRLPAALAHDEARSGAASQWTTLAAIAPLVAERGRLELAAELLAASEAWPAGPLIQALADGTRGRIAERLPAERQAEAAARGQAQELAAAKASARGALAE